jgi:hypothetical protein
MKNTQEYVLNLARFKSLKTEEEKAAFDQEQTERIAKQTPKEELEELGFILNRLNELKKEVIPLKTV